MQPPNRGIDVDHVTIYGCKQLVGTTFHAAVDRSGQALPSLGWRSLVVDETYVKVSGKWRYVYRAVDQHGQIIDIYVSKRRNIPAARQFFTKALSAHGVPVEVVTDLAQALETVIEEQVPDAFHNTERFANNRVECDHGRLKSRLRPMRGLKTDQGASVMIRKHGLIQNLRRGHYELGVEAGNQHLRIAAAFDELTSTI